MKNEDFDFQTFKKVLDSYNEHLELFDARVSDKVKKLYSHGYRIDVIIDKVEIPRLNIIEVSYTTHGNMENSGSVLMTTGELTMSDADYQNHLEVLLAEKMEVDKKIREDMENKRKDKALEQYNKLKNQYGFE